MTKTVCYILLSCGLLHPIHALAQQPAYTYYTLRDGLPSNDIYNCVEDRKGFLWVATENGLSKFDGKNFKNYFTGQGLPDNEILNVQIDSAGVIWVLPFQRSPAYYDEKRDRFINSNSDPELRKISLSLVNNCNALANGGMAFYTVKGVVSLYREKKCESYDLNTTHSKFGIYRVMSLSENKFLTVSADSLRIIRSGKVIGRAAFHLNALQTVFVNRCLYVADSFKILKYAVDTEGRLTRLAQIVLPFPVKALNFTGKQLSVNSASGNIYFADTATLSFGSQSFSFNTLVRCVYEDRSGNTWICTKEKGIIRYQNKGILTINTPAFQRNFNAICFAGKDLVAGTNDGGVYIYSSPYAYRQVSLFDNKNYSSWVRRIIPVEKGIYIATEGGLFFSDRRTGVTGKYHPSLNIASKDMVLLNDSVAICGTGYWAKKMNLRTRRTIDSVSLRVTVLKQGFENSVYIGSNTGLYKWESNNPLRNLGVKYPILSNRVSSLACNPADSMVWIGLGTDSLVAVRNDIPLGVIPLNAALPGNTCRALFSMKKGIVWLGTNLALGRIDYKVAQHSLHYKTAVFTVADGLAGKQVNDITERDDTMYVATTAGISIFPASLYYAARDIPVYITGIKINNSDTTLQSDYSLKYDRNNISISYSAADLGAPEERTYEYHINNGPWIRGKTENIELQELSPGEYTVEVRALKRDGLPSAKMAVVTFQISTPFWKHSLFYILTTLFLLFIGYYFLQRRSRIKREESIHRILIDKKLSDLELKALKAQINPHFVFNCLNSIKYLNHQKRFDETETYLDRFSYLLRKTLDFSGLQLISLQDELTYSRNYLELEKLRLGEKLQFEFIIGDELNAKETFLPPMLLQPYLENAVKHGIRHLDSEKGKITIEAGRVKEEVRIKISDNGIGIEESVLLNAAADPDRVSHGNTLQERRAALFGITVNITQNIEGRGTTVMLTYNNIMEKKHHGKKDQYNHR